VSDMSREDLATWAALADDREGRAILALLADVERLTERAEAAETQGNKLADGLYVWRDQCEKAEAERDALLAAMFAAADELDAWDGDASPVLDGHSPGGVIRHAILALDGDD